MPCSAHLDLEGFRGFRVFERVMYDTMEEDDDSNKWLESIEELCRDIASVGLSSVHYLEIIIDAEDSREMPPPTRPLDLAAMPVSDFQDLTMDVKRRLVSVLGSDAPRQACFETRDLWRDMQRGGTLKEEFLEAVQKPTATFQEYWDPAGSKYKALRKVAGGFATIFPGSSAVESEFSTVNRDKSPLPLPLS